MSEKNSFEALDMGDVRRIYAMLYGHESHSNSKSTLARAVEQKASALASRSLDESFLSTVRTPSASIRLVPRHPGASAATAAASTNAASVRRPQSAAAGSRGRPASPMYLRAVGASTEKTIAAWLSEMRVDSTPPQRLMTLRQRYLANPSAHEAEWVAFCKSNCTAIKHRLRAQLCCNCIGYAAGTTRRSRSATTKQNASSVASVDASGGVDFTAVRDDRQAHAIAEWKLSRFVEQGPSYLYQVLHGGKINVGQLSATYNGLYVIPNADMIGERVKLIRSHRGKLRRLDELLAMERSAAASGDEQHPALTDHAGAPQDDDEDGGGGAAVGGDDEEEDDADPSDNVPQPTVDVSISPSNLLVLRVHLSNAQVKSLLKNRPETDPVCRSTFAFSTEAACIGPDRWIGISGHWKHRIVHFSRTADGSVDSLFVDGICFEKKLIRVGGREDDPFKCTACGSVRTKGNVVYAARQQGNRLMRGQYHCAICDKFTLHVCMVRELQRAKPRWNPTVSHDALSIDILSEQPFREFKGKRVGYSMANPIL